MGSPALSFHKTEGLIGKKISNIPLYLQQILSFTKAILNINYKVTLD